jgi:hypothetical protein
VSLLGAPEPVSPVTSASYESPAPAADPSEVFLVFRAAGHTYMQLGESKVAHGVPRLSHSDDDALYASVAPVKQVPADVAIWQGKHVIVDGTCDATVEGFALVSQLTGDTGYAGIEDSEWTAKNVMKAGTPVLAARLSDCDGTYARGAALPPSIELVDDASDHGDLVDQARARVRASDAATRVKAEWSTRVMRHPATGVTWIAVHASRDEGCGGDNANAFGLFRVTAAGELETVSVRDLGEMHAIASLVDIDDDGTPELVGTDWLGLDTLITRASGEPLASSHVQFFGCPC